MPRMLSPEELDTWVPDVVARNGYTDLWLDKTPEDLLYTGNIGNLGTRGLGWLVSRVPSIANLGSNITGLGSKAINNVKNLFRSPVKSKALPEATPTETVNAIRESMGIPRQVGQRGTNKVNNAMNEAVDAINRSVTPEMMMRDLGRSLSDSVERVMQGLPTTTTTAAAKRAAPNIAEEISRFQNPNSLQGVLRDNATAVGLGIPLAGVAGVGINSLLENQIAPLLSTATSTSTTPTNYTPVSVQYNPNNSTLSATPIQTTTPITQNENIYVPSSSSTQVTTPSTTSSKGRRTIAEDFNNPLNISSGKNVRGRGAYKQYNSLEEGFRDSWQQLQNLQDRNKIQTLGQLIDNWERSPKKKSQYLNFVMNNTGLKADDLINLKDVNQAANIIAAMSKFESPLGKRYNADTVKGILSNNVATPNPYFNAPWLADQYIDEYLK